MKEGKDKKKDDKRKPLPPALDFGGPLGRPTGGGEKPEGSIVDSEAFKRKPPPYPSLF